MNQFLERVVAGLVFAGALAATMPAKGSEQYFLLNTSATANPASTSSPSNVMAYVQQKFGAANAASDLKVGVAVIYYPGGANGISGTLTLLTNDLATAQRLKVPILIQVDVENSLPISLLNWYDPTQPGYDTNKTADVEWYGWGASNAVKLCWRQWGTQIRVGPQPNWFSPNFQAWERSVYTNYIPYVLQWYDGLSVTQKWLFAGWKCGWETGQNQAYFYYTNGNSYYINGSPQYGLVVPGDPSSGSRQTLGYNAAQTSGFKTNGVLDFSGANGNEYDIGMKITGKHLTYLASLAYSNGIPRDKIFIHTIAEGVDRYNSDKLVNPYANPGVTGTGVMRDNASLMRAVRTVKGIYGGTGYGYGEFAFNSTNYATWFNWITNALAGDPDCVFQALYNYDSMKGKTNAEQAMLNAMLLYPKSHILIYKGNGNTVGVPPDDAGSPFTPGATVSVLGKGTLGKSGSSFAGWNTSSDGAGNSYEPGDTFPVLADTTLFAQWVPTAISATSTGTKVVLTWPAGQGWQLQAQTNNLNTGLRTNWSTIAGAIPPSTNNISAASAFVAYRLYQPPNVLGTNFAIYRDALAPGWSLNGFGTSPVVTNNPSPVHGGAYSMAYNLAASGGRGPFGPQMSTTNFNYLSFWIHGGTAGGQTLNLTVHRVGAPGGTAATWYIPSVPANMWVNYLLPLDLIGLRNVPDFNGLRFVNNLTGLNAPTFYVDDIELRQ